MTPGVGRPELVSTRADLGQGLTALRSRAGLSVRRLARQLETPVATLGDYFSGRHLPGPTQLGLFTRLLAACGVDDPEEVEAWLAALARARRASDRRSARVVAPYLGLEAFDEEDAGRFFGREAMTRELLDLVACSAAPGEAVVALVGASGSGKSSLLRAGLAAAVRQGALAAVAPGAGTGWSVLVCTPGDDPAGSLDRALRQLTEPALLVVDQLEELFAPSVTRQARSAFLQRLVPSSGPSRRVVVGLRADFYEDAARERALLPVLARNQVLLGPMTEDELRTAIVEPARQAGAVVEESLVERLMADLASRGAAGPVAHEAGALPLLSHAMLATWQRTAGNELTLAAYRESGGLHGAIRQSAEDLYVGLQPADQALARQLFLRLVHVADDAPSTRRRVRRQELSELDAAAPGASIDAVLGRFVDGRLLTADADTIAISHEALLDAWPRLGQWLEEGRADVRLRHQLSEAAQSWQSAGHDEALLLRGSRLQVAADWLAEPGHRALLNRSEADLVEASLAQRSAEAAVSRSRSRRMQQLLATTAALAVAAAGLAAYAFQSRSEATTARDQALSRQLAIESEQLQPTQPALAAQLALAGYRISPTVGARSALLDATATDLPTRLAGPAGPAYVSLAPSAHLLAVARSLGDDVTLYRLLRRPRRLATVPAGPRRGQVFDTALSPGGRLLAAGGTGRDVALFGLADPARPRRLAVLGGFSSTVYAVAFSRDGHELAAASADGTVRCWRLPGAGRGPILDRVLRGPRGASFKALAISPSGQLVVAAGQGGSLYVWHGRSARPSLVAAGAGSVVEALALSPDGRLLASGTKDGTVGVYDVAADGRVRPAHRPLAVSKAIVYALAFSPHGRTLAAGDAGGTIRLVSTTTFRPAGSLREADPVTGLAYDGSGRLVAADGTGDLHLWPMPPVSDVRAPGNVYFLERPVADPDRLFVVSGGVAGDVGVWTLADPAHPRLVASIRPPASFGPVDGSAAVSPDGRLLAVADRQAAIQLYDVADPRRPVPVGPPLQGDTPLIEELAFSPNGRVLVAGDDGGRIHRWNLTDPSRPRPLPTLAGPASQVLGLAFSPNGRLLAAASADAHVWLYDVAVPGRPRRLARLGGFRSYAFSVAFTPDGRTLVAGGGDDTVRLWSLADPRHPRPLGRPLDGPASYVFQLAVSPNGRTLAGVTTDGKVWLWDIADPARPSLEATLQAAAGGPLFAVDFGPAGHSLLASGTDGVVHRWAATPAEAAARICAAAGTPVSRADWRLYAPGAPYRPPCPG